MFGTAHSIFLPFALSRDPPWSSYALLLGEGVAATYFGSHVHLRVLSPGRLLPRTRWSGALFHCLEQAAGQDQGAGAVVDAVHGLQRNRATR